MMRDPNIDELEAIKRRLVRDDYAVYLSLKRLAPRYQAPLFFLNGFFRDVSKIAFRVDEPLLGEIRLQWWRDGIAKLARDERLGHPVADALAPFLVQYGGPLKTALLSVVDSFGNEVQKTPVLTQKSFHERLAARYGGLFAASFIMADLNTEGREDLLAVAGIAVGATEALSRLPLTYSEGMKLLPQDLLDEVELDYNELLSGAVPEKTERLIERLSDNVELSSWAVKRRLAGLSWLERQLLARWVLVPRLYRLSCRDRIKGSATVSQLNPLKLFFVLLLLRP